MAHAGATKPWVAPVNRHGCARSGTKVRQRFSGSVVITSNGVVRGRELRNGFQSKRARGCLAKCARSLSMRPPEDFSTSIVSVDSKFVKYLTIKSATQGRGEAQRLADAACSLRVVMSIVAGIEIHMGLPSAGEKATGRVEHVVDPPRAGSGGGEDQCDPQPQPCAVSAFSPASNEWPQAQPATAFGLRTVNPPPIREFT